MTGAFGLGASGSSPPADTPPHELPILVRPLTGSPPRKKPKRDRRATTTRAAWMAVAAGYEPRRTVVLDDGTTAFYFEDAARSTVERFQQVKSMLRAHESKARREVQR